MDGPGTTIRYSSSVLTVETRLDGACDLADFVHRVNFEVNGHAKTWEIVPGLIEPCKDQFALPVRGGYDRR